VATSAVAAAATSIAGVAQQVQDRGTGLVAALASAQGALGDPAATATMSEVVSAWIFPLGALGVLLARVSAATQQAAVDYTDTDTAIAQAAR
jgi:uncharacterized protein YukE